MNTKLSPQKYDAIETDIGLCASIYSKKNILVSSCTNQNYASIDVKSSAPKPTCTLNKLPAKTFTIVFNLILSADKQPHNSAHSNLTRRNRQTTTETLTKIPTKNKYAEHQGNHA
ncbi:hypothetical protein [Pseudomonas viridiflava]|uniref:hypothetical protein n=1 Tax=Pseudomonas viridiflava TaxID=33069 RepID=UPI0013D45819|nr:hypothetical protein [Pseudomonas viridiflava]MEE4087856.1 hypothetical protein [Pseudomonas viridiflava]